jgi:transposase-like protein
VRNVSDEQLAVRAAAGDGDAFEELARRYRPLIGAATRWLPDGLEPDDARQAALLGLFEACRATDGIRRFAGLAAKRVRWQVAAARRAATTRKHRVLTDAIHGNDERDGALAWIAAPDATDPARVVELREVLREQVRDHADTQRRRANAPRGDLRRRYTPEQVDRALALIAAGSTISDAAAAVGARYRAVHEWLDAAPPDSPAGRQLAAIRQCGPSGNAARRFSRDERARAVKMVADGNTISAAASAIGASHPTVVRWLRNAA